jgi:hypothetical protein
MIITIPDELLKMDPDKFGLLIQIFICLKEYCLLHNVLPYDSEILRRTGITGEEIHSVWTNEDRSQMSIEATCICSANSFKVSDYKRKQNLS